MSAEKSMEEFRMPASSAPAMFSVPPAFAFRLALASLSVSTLTCRALSLPFCSVACSAKEGACPTKRARLLSCQPSLEKSSAAEQSTLTASDNSAAALSLMSAFPSVSPIAFHSRAARGPEARVTAQSDLMRSGRTRILDSSAADARRLDEASSRAARPG